MHFFFVFSEGPDLHLVFAVDASFSFDLKFKFMNGLLELHLVLEQFFNFFKAVADDNLKLFFLDGQNFSISGMLFCSALLGGRGIRTFVNRTRILRCWLPDLDFGLDVNPVVNRQVSENFIFLFQLSQYLVLSALDFRKSSWFWGNNSGLNSLRDSLSVIDFTESTCCVFCEIILFGLFKSCLV